MRKCVNTCISPYIRRPLDIYDFATASFWISLCMGKIWFSFFLLFISVYIIFLLMNLRCRKSGIYKLKKACAWGTWDAWVFFNYAKFLVWRSAVGDRMCQARNISPIQEHIPPCSPGIHSRFKSGNIPSRERIRSRNVFLIEEHPVSGIYFRSRIILKRPSVCEVILSHG
jgi:hypothetical protein